LQQQNADEILSQHTSMSVGPMAAMQEGQRNAAIKFAAWPQAGNQSCQAASAVSTNFIPVAMSTHSLAINAKILTVVHQIPDVIISFKPCEL